ncbi:MAG: DnaJ domain-containing protein, partial [Myxococcota bacterium]|nr:DnaJ domain-containing protein [Myxococcota bacterium]
MAEDKSDETRQLIVERHKAATDGDYFAALGLEQGADADKVSSAYLKMAKSIHPDMVDRKGLDDVKKEATELFRFITEARDVLTDKKRRAQYERGEVEAQAVGQAGSAAKNARDVSKLAYQKGSVMLKKRGWAEAEKHLQEAVKAKPDEPRYWQKLGWSIYQNTEDRDDAERLEEASK